MRVKKNYKKEARLSTKQAKKIACAAKAVTVIYSLAILALFGLMLVIPLTKKITVLDSILAVFDGFPLIHILVAATYLIFALSWIISMISVAITYAKRRKKLKRRQYATEYASVVKYRNQKKAIKAWLKEHKKIKRSVKIKAKRALKKVNHDLRLAKYTLRMAKGRVRRAELNETFVWTVNENIREMRVFEYLFRFVLAFVVGGLLAVAVLNYNKWFDLMSLILVGVGLLFHFITGIIKGRVTPLRWDNNAAFYHYLSGKDEYGYDMDFFVGKTRSFKNDGSDAVLEIPEREFPLTMFVFRNLFQVVFTACLSVLLVFTISKLDAVSGELDDPFGLIFSFVGYAGFFFLWFMWAHALNGTEYEYDCMNESIQKMRIVYRVFSVVMAVLGIGVLVLALVAGVAKPTTIIICGVVFVILGVSALMIDIALRPKDRERTDDDFFSLDEAEANGDIEY